MMTGRQATGRWPSGDMSRVKPVPFLPDVQSPPLRLGASPVRMALRGKARDYAKGDFLGGARSPRPYGQAVRKPGHNKIIGGKRTPGGQMGTCSGEANSVVAGVRSPPLQGESHPGQDGLARKTLE